MSSPGISPRGPARREPWSGRAATSSVRRDPEKALADEPAHEDETALVVEPSREIGRRKLTIRVEHELDLRSDPRREPERPPLVGEGRLRADGVEVGDHGLASDQRRVDVQLLERTQLVEDVPTERAP